MSKTYPNRFFRGWCSNEGNPRSNILHYHIYTIRDISDYEGGSIPEEAKSIEEYFNVDGEGVGDPYYAVFGTFKMNISRGQIKLFETDRLKDAIFMVESITGNTVAEYDV